MGRILLVAALVLGACGDNEPRTKGEDVRDLAAYAASVSEECGFSSADARKLPERFCAHTDCAAESDFDIGKCFDDIDIGKCSFLGFPEDCQRCGFTIPVSCRALWR